MNKMATALRGQTQVFWNGLALREKRMLAGVGLVLASLLIWLVLIQPRAEEDRLLASRNPQVARPGRRLAGAVAGRQRAPGPAERGAALRQALDSAGLQGHYHLQALDAGGWHLTFDNAPADAVVGWLLGNPRSFSLEVVEARLQRARGRRRHLGRHCVRDRSHGSGAWR